MKSRIATFVYVAMMVVGFGGALLLATCRPGLRLLDRAPARPAPRAQSPIRVSSAPRGPYAAAP